MLIKLLSDSDKLHLIELAKLLALSDNPLLWDGKTVDEFTSDTDLSALTIQESELERELIAELEQSVGPRSAILERERSDNVADGLLSINSFFSAWFPVDVGARLVNVLKTFPIPKAANAETRIQAATTVLKELLSGKTFELPTAPKVILFELLLVALRDGNISNIEWTLLKEFQLHHQLDDFIFDDLLERAETLNQEVSKTISIILE